MHGKTADFNSGNLEPPISVSTALTLRPMSHKANAPTLLPIVIYQPGGFHGLGANAPLLRPVFDIKLLPTFGKRSERDVPIETQFEEAHISIVVNGSIIFNDLGGIDRHLAGVGFDDPGEFDRLRNWRLDDDYGVPGQDGDPYAVDEGQWNQEEEFYYYDQEEELENYDIDEHDDGHDDGRDFDDDDDD